MKGLFLVTIVDKKTGKDIEPMKEVYKECDPEHPLYISFIRESIKSETHAMLAKEAKYRPTLKKIYERGNVVVEVEFIGDWKV